MHYSNNKGWEAAVLVVTNNPSSSTFANCLIINNESESPRLTYSHFASEVSFINCTIADNLENSDSNSIDKLFEFDGGEGEFSMANSILWNNNQQALVNESNLNNQATNSLIDVDTSALDTYQNPVIGDPGFVSSIGVDYYLSEISPCINSGQNGLAPFDLDLKWEDRIIESVVDLGCFEGWVSGFTCLGDADGNGVVNVTDLLAVSSNYGCMENCTLGDADGNGVVNITDLVTVSSYFGFVCD